jgi:hypothetical protein
MRGRQTSDEVLLRRGLIATVVILALMVAVEALL